MKRRSTLAFLAAASAIPSAARAQAKRLPRLCLLTFDSEASDGRRYSTFFDRLRALGHIDGQTITIDWLSSSTRQADFSILAEECVRNRVDLIVGVTTPAATAAKRATSTIPIVTLAIGDPVGSGLVDNLARPGINLTGTTTLAPAMRVKGLELLKQAVPGLKRVMVLTYASDPISRVQVDALRQAAPALGV